ncbi:LysE family translocator [Salinispirillum sp. LH 10-3-1]|uniref:LysE family translocator n=1 Tax=Salinispirillum sp. LH 10-3-1 TaxID=2952525 RepID=A0AB38YF66_9GAMM
MDATYVLSLLLFTFVATITPGPNNIMLTASGANFGFRRTVPHLLGIAFGFSFMAIVVALGLGVVFEMWPMLYTLLKIVGSAYLLFLAWKIYRAGRVQLQRNEDLAKDAKPLSFWQAAAFQWVNPKAWTMVLTALAAFSLPPPLHIWSSAAVIVAYFVVSFPACSFWALLGQEVVKLLRSDRARLWFNGTLASLTVASVALIFI